MSYRGQGVGHWPWLGGLGKWWDGGPGGSFMKELAVALTISPQVRGFEQRTNSIYSHACVAHG